MADFLHQLDMEHIRDDLPDFAPGDTIKVLYRVREGQKERIQVFQGVCLGRRGSGMGETFTVRKLSGGIGVGADLSGQRADRRRDRDRAARPRAQGKALLPEGPAREGRPDQGEADAPAELDKPVDKTPVAFERRCIRVGPLRPPGHTVVSSLRIVAFSLHLTSSKLHSSLPFGRIALLFASQGASPTRCLAALGAHAGLSTDC